MKVARAGPERNNVGMAGEVVRLYLNKASREPLEAVEVARAIEGGLEGDKHVGHPTRQVLIIEAEILDEFKLQPGQLRENVVTRGVKVQGTPAGTRLKIGEAELEITHDCSPCHFVDALQPGLKKKMVGRRGMLARVVKSGNLRVRDVVEIA